MCTNTVLNSQAMFVVYLCAEIGCMAVKPVIPLPNRSSHYLEKYHCGSYRKDRLGKQNILHKKRTVLGGHGSTSQFTATSV